MRLSDTVRIREFSISVAEQSYKYNFQPGLLFIHSNNITHLQALWLRIPLRIIHSEHSQRHLKQVNPLKTKRRPLYLKTQSVPRSEHFSSRL